MTDRRLSTPSAALGFLQLPPHVPCFGSRPPHLASRLVMAGVDVLTVKELGG